MSGIEQQFEADGASTGRYRFASDDLGQSALLLWARDARQAHLIAQSLAKTAFVSSTLRGKPDEITGAILTGQEIGLAPMAALRSIDVIGGVPAMRAHALRGMVQSRGHDVWVAESTATRAVVCGKRKGSDREQRSVWTTDRAKRLGLTGKDNWQKMPEAMLVARATAEVCRLVASDVLLGMPYAVEELDADVDAPDTPTVTSAPRKARRQVERVESETPALETSSELAPDEPRSEPAEVPLPDVES